MNRTLEEHLRCFVGLLQDDWDVHLANAEFAVDSTVNSSTKIAPFEADLGYIPLNPLYLTAEQLDNIPKSRRGAEFHEHHAAILLRCREALGQTQERMRNAYDRNRVEQEFEVSDRVYLSTRNLDRKHIGLPNSSKFGPKWMGPYSIVRKVHNHAYELNIQSGNKLHPRTKSLIPTKRRNFSGWKGWSTRSNLVGKRRHKRHTQFLVEWVGEEKPTCVKVEDLGQVPNFIAKFEEIRRSKRHRRTRKQ
ncbi:hypothetical protein PHMEG_00033710 [Phytophthora megakarya]|uniref:Chromo domain-containing protein n=1 Tax=Phytophthora megakarya TaxID=4795 RepID=A0A225UT52_9STRA|nr:hypothetical protein PHMEG_00033710 [Phytophthora megakarya]